MTLKSLRYALSVVLLVASHSRAGLISLEGAGEHQHQELHNHHPEHHEVSVASSYMHFHGPVEGPEFEVKVPYIEPHHHQHEHEHEHEHHHGYVLDYVAHPKYQFSYGVEDHHTGDFHSQKETRDGSSVSGEYSVAEPGGGLRIVSYRADKDGFHAVVHTTGKNDHSGGTYGYQTHHHHQPIQEPHPIHEAQATTLEHHQQEHHHQHQEQDQQQLLQEYQASFPVQEEAGY